MLNTLFRKRLPSIEEKNQLKACLSALDLFLLGVGVIIGTGIFVLTGIVAANQAGPAVILSFIIAGCVCTFAALSYAELASSIGGCGSAYGYSYAAFGELVAWIVGWDLILEYGVSVAAVANGWSGYFNNFMVSIGVELPRIFLKSPDAGGLMNLPAMVIIFILMLFLLTGTKESARLNSWMVCVKITAIAIFGAIALSHFNIALWEPFMPFGWFGYRENGSTIGVLAGASVVFFAYVGFDALSTAAEEAKNPKKDVPKGILGALIFCTMIYVVVSGLLTGIVPYTELNVSSPVAHALYKLGIHWAAALVATGVIAGLTTVMLVMYYGLTRVIFAMARDGLLPFFFKQIDRTRKTPDHSIILSGAAMMLLSGFLPLSVLAELVNIGTLTAFFLVCLGVIVMRFTHPFIERPFKLPFGVLIPLLGAVFCLILIAFLPHITHWRFLCWLGLGLLIYFGYSMHHSRLARWADQGSTDK